MIKTVKQACKFNPIIRDYRMSQGIENLAHLINDEGDGREFLPVTTSLTAWSSFSVRECFASRANRTRLCLNSPKPWVVVKPT